MENQEPKFFLSSKKELIDYVISWEEQGNPLRIDPHLKYDRAFRNVSMRDCKYVLTKDIENSLQWPPEWDSKHQNHVLHIKGEDLDGREVELIFRIDFRNATIIVITWKA
jgi:hypothetical protein